MRWLALLLLSAPATAAPIVPQFTQGTMTSHTETTSKVTERRLSARTIQRGLNTVLAV